MGWLGWSPTGPSGGLGFAMANVIIRCRNVRNAAVNNGTLNQYDVCMFDQTATQTETDGANLVLGSVGNRFVNCIGATSQAYFLYGVVQSRGPVLRGEYMDVMFCGCTQVRVGSTGVAAGVGQTVNTGADSASIGGQIAGNKVVALPLEAGVSGDLVLALWNGITGWNSAV